MAWKRKAIELAVKEFDLKELEPHPNWGTRGEPVCNRLCPLYRTVPSACVATLSETAVFAGCRPVAAGMALMLDAQSKLSTLERLKKLLVRP